MEKQTKKAFREGYLFLIVNNANDLTAIYSTVGSITTTYSTTNLYGKTTKYKSEEEYVFYSFCNRPESITSITDKYVERLKEVETIVSSRVAATKSVQKFVPKNVNSNPDIYADVRKIYWQICKGTTEYLISKHDPEAFMNAYVSFYGEVYNNINDKIRIIGNAIKYAQTLNKTVFVNDFINDYTEWKTILESDLVGQSGQKVYDQYLSWD